MASSETTLNLPNISIYIAFLFISPPPPLADGSLPDGRIGVPDLASVFLVALLQDDPAQAEPGAAVEAVDGEDDDEGHPEDAAGPGHGGGQRQHPAPSHLARQKNGGAKNSQPLTLTHMSHGQYKYMWPNVGHLKGQTTLNLVYLSFTF